jgi:hypothetical protein
MLIHETAFADSEIAHSGRSTAHWPTFATQSNGQRRQRVRRMGKFWTASYNEQEPAGRRLSCNMNSVDVRRHLSKILILSILDFAIGFEIHYGPTIEIRRVLLKSKINNTFDHRDEHLRSAKCRRTP